jgi:hypothetical protein
MWGVPACVKLKLKTKTKTTSVQISAINNWKTGRHSNLLGNWNCDYYAECTRGMKTYIFYSVQHMLLAGKLGLSTGAGILSRVAELEPGNRPELQQNGFFLNFAQQKNNRGRSQLIFPSRAMQSPVPTKKLFRCPSPPLPPLSTPYLHGDANQGPELQSPQPYERISYGRLTLAHTGAGKSGQYKRFRPKVSPVTVYWWLKFWRLCMELQFLDRT